MSVALDKTVLILLASGRSRRYGRRDKLMEKLAGKPLVKHAADVLGGMDAMAHVAVCPSGRPEIGERLQPRFVVALNKAPARGMGHSIAVGVHVAMQFKPDAVLICMADMPFIEEVQITDLLSRLGGEGGHDIVHSGGKDGARPPTAFTSACFADLEALDGDEGARLIMTDPKRRILGLSAPAPLLRDVDTKDDLQIAAKQYALRQRYLGAAT
jgi:molybdenum cofactor cytidylyltransferase